MKTITVNKPVKIQLLEKGDIIMCTHKQSGKNHYALVVKDQTPKNTDDVYVYDMSFFDKRKWYDIHNEDMLSQKCEFVMHLDNIAIMSH